MSAAAIIQIAMTVLPLIQAGVPEFIAFINSLKGTVEQAGDWTPELQEQYRAALWASTKDPAYQP